LQQCPQIANWLGKLGMSEYTERFAENGISVAALPYLTDQDLKDIGVLLGHRRILLAAIGELTSAAPATPAPPVEAKLKPQHAGERAMSQRIKGHRRTLSGSQRLKPISCDCRCGGDRRG
jgi:SAM domain (Sterile alpha motif)